MTDLLAIDLCCGLGGWTEGLLAEGYDVLGFDIERHVYGAHRYPAQLVIQDVLTLHGAQFRDATLIVASPPCQFHYAAKLTEDDVREIRRLGATGKLFHREIAAMYGINRQSITRILSGQAWRRTAA